eukprot:scaffold2442_cov146-Cylindrotheca_fusiformis.AAC.8
MQREEEEGVETSSNPICRIVTRADSKLPTTPSTLPESLFQEPHLLEKLDSYYNAQAYKRTKTLSYLIQSKQQQRQHGDLNAAEVTMTIGDNGEEQEENRAEMEQELVSVVHNSLKDAGFQLLSRRDLDLCDSLNVGYLLRLSIAPALSELDPSIAKEFYPELEEEDFDELLFGGRCLVFWRGYSKEVTTGRLILPKIDYLQTSVVRRSAAWIKRRLDVVEAKLTNKADRQGRKLQSKFQDWKESIIPKAMLSKFYFLEDDDDDVEYELEDDGEDTTSRKKASSCARDGVHYGRYGGPKLRFVATPDPDDALDPFMICEVQDYDPPNGSTTDDEILNEASSAATENAAEHDMYDKLNHYGYRCEYDEKMAYPNGRQRLSRRIHLLERVSINNLVDVFSRRGRGSLLQTLFSKSKLVEPTYEEVVVVWRPKIEKKIKFYPPKFVSDFADIFDIDGFEQPSEQEIAASTGNLEIRNFQDVPMSNIQAVLPDTKLVFRPADALLFDTISIVTFALVAGSIRLDSPRLDLLAIISVSLWIIRTAIRYSNKLARYDLLVKNFLTSKISHRNKGALRYLLSEAGLQRAIRASLVYSWISNMFQHFARSKTSSKEDNDDDDSSSKSSTANGTTATGTTISRSLIEQSCIDDINAMLKTDMEVEIDVDRALKDLEDLLLIKFSKDGEHLVEVTDSSSSVETLKEAWSKLLLERNVRIRKRKAIKRKKRGDGTMTDIASIIASNLLSSLEGNRKPLESALQIAQEQGYTKVKEMLEDEDNKQALGDAIASATEQGYKGYNKAKELIQDQIQAGLLEGEVEQKNETRDEEMSDR